MKDTIEDLQSVSCVDQWRSFILQTKHNEQSILLKELRYIIEGESSVNLYRHAAQR